MTVAVKKRKENKGREDDQMIESVKWNALRTSEVETGSGWL